MWPNVNDGVSGKHNPNELDSSVWIFNCAVRDVDNNKRYAEVTEHMAALRTKSFWEMLFSPELEQRYQQVQNDWYRESIRISSLMAILLLSTSYIVEWGTDIYLVWYTLVIRAIAIVALLATYWYARRSQHLTWKFWFVAFNTLLIASTLLLMAQETTQPIKLMYYCNVFFVEVVVFTFIRLPLNFTNTLGLVLLLMVASALYLDSMTLQVSAHVMFFMLSGTLISVMVSIKTEKMSRESFLKSEMIQYEKSQLRDLNDRINEEVSLDRVTRLMNRVAFEDKLLSTWSLATQNDRLLMMVAIHVEYFSYFNEQRGAECGDDLLREISRKIRSVLMDANDLGCRISGGRFVLLLSGTENVMNSQLESLREKLLHLSALERAPAMKDKVYLSWGRVNLDPEVDRDPRGTIDRMFRHLSAMENHALSCHARNKGQQA